MSVLLELVVRVNYLQWRHVLLYSAARLTTVSLDICISYNMGKRDLPDIYALAGGLQARGRGHIYQANPDCPCYK